MICAIVVTFNREKLLLDCLNAIINQTVPPDGIYIVDNCSRDDTPQALLSKGYIPDFPQKINANLEINKTLENKITVHYIRLSENLGGAGGFYEGIKRAYSKNYKFLWLMDDDGLPSPTALENLLNKKLSEAVLCSLVVDKDVPDKLCFGLKIRGKYYYNMQKVTRFANSNNLLAINTGNFFNSILIPRVVVQKVGFPDKSLFIWGDELEYLFRIIKHKFKVVSVTDSIHYHPFPSKKMVKWKQYYMVRNSIILIQRYKYFKYIIVPIRALLKIIIMDGLTGRNTKLIALGIYDGLRHRLGRTILP